MSHKRWIVQEKFPKDIVSSILKNRGVHDTSEFFKPTVPEKISFKELGISEKEVKKATERIMKAKATQETVVVYGDYDVDGVCATTIMWQTLNKMGLKAYPFIPDRFKDGYGMSISGIEKIMKLYPETRLIISVDNGIVAAKAIKYANKKNIDVIVTDHHEKQEKIDSYCTIHTTKICGTAISWFLSKHLLQDKEYIHESLDLVGFATISDQMKLVDINRSLAYHGINSIKKSNRTGLIALCEESDIDIRNVGVYEIGYVLGPRINASGRLADALVSVRLLCTKNKVLAKKIAGDLTALNTKRQEVLVDVVNLSHEKANLELNVIIVAGNFHEGVIGLAAGRLVEEYGKPAVVFSTKGEVVKASARSVPGIHITEFLKSASSLPINVGGHEMAAGLSIKHEDLEKYIEKLSKKSADIDKELLTKVRKIDCEISLNEVSLSLSKKLEQMEPFGMGNPTPVFLTSNALILNTKTIGKEKNHLKIQLENKGKPIDCLFFNANEKVNDFQKENNISIVYSINKNVWNNMEKVQLLLKDYIIDNDGRTSKT